MEQFSQSGSRGRRRTGNEPAPHERVKSERRANEPRRTASPHRASANNAGRANTPAAEQTPARPKSRYIPALDGLRTLAVVAVVLYHLNLTWAQGGLLGVTIFFVLSGYLITRLLLNEVAKTGHIDLKSFWIRRIRRLVPAVVTVVFVTCALCTIFNHVMLTKMRPDILPSLLFFNNWWQIAQNVSYFNALGDPSPLTHFWSLAIEEQFYLIWPPLLFAMVSMHVS
ncbi:MAG: acyltransferase, partial [Collinsella sp.]|nr:acyltransferase [Collinsella sp.]